MLIADIERYLALRQSLGFKLQNDARNLRAYGRLADACGDHHVRARTAHAWAAKGTSTRAQNVRLRAVIRLARFLAAEDSSHEIPTLSSARTRAVRPPPYIYTMAEIRQIIAAVGRLHVTYPLCRAVFSTLIGLLAATGLRLSEALNLRFEDVLADGVLHVRHAKFGKSRLVPLHPTTAEALHRFLVVRRAAAVPDDHLFLSAGNKRLSKDMAGYTFRRLLNLAGIAEQRARRPRIHDLRHTFATRVLEQCASERRAVSRHFVALSTYLGHVDVKSTYWYLEATPELMTDIAAAGELLASGGGR